MVVSIQDSLIALYLMNIFPSISNKNMFIHINFTKLTLYGLACQAHLDKIFISISGGIIKKFPVSVVTMSR